MSDTTIQKTFLVMLTCEQCRCTQTLSNLPWDKLAEMDGGDRWEFTCPNCKVNDKFTITLAATSQLFLVRAARCEHPKGFALNGICLDCGSHL